MKLLLRLSPLALLLIATIPSRAQTVRDVISFTGQNQTGESAMTPAQGRDGRLYGTSASGSDFSLSVSGNLSIIHLFEGTQGGFDPIAGLTLESDGNLYGTASSGGAGQNGVLYRLSPEGTFSVLHNFMGGGDGA